MFQTGAKMPRIGKNNGVVYWRCKTSKRYKYYYVCMYVWIMEYTRTYKLRRLQAICKQYPERVINECYCDWYDISANDLLQNFRLCKMIRNQYFEAERCQTQILRNNLETIILEIIRHNYNDMKLLILLYLYYVCKRQYFALT